MPINKFKFFLFFPFYSILYAFYYVAKRLKIKDPEEIGELFFIIGTLLSIFAFIRCFFYNFLSHLWETVSFLNYGIVVITFIMVFSYFIKGTKEEAKELLYYFENTKLSKLLLAFGLIYFILCVSIILWFGLSEEATRLRPRRLPPLIE